MPQVNVWGYSHINFFSPMSRFAANGKGPVAAAREFKQMVNPGFCAYIVMMGTGHTPRHCIQSKAHTLHEEVA